MYFDREYLFNKKVKQIKCDGFFENNYGQTRAMFFDGEPYLGKQTTCFAYLGIPNSPMPKGGYPAIIVVHGGGGCAFYEWVEYWNSKGYVAIAPDFSSRQFGSHKLDGTAGKGVVPVNENGRPVDYGSFSSLPEDYKNSWSYHCVCNIIFAHNILLDLDVVNKEKKQLLVFLGVVF